MANENNQQEQRLTKRQRRELKRQEEASERGQQNRRKLITRWAIIALCILVIAGIIYWAISANQRRQDLLNTPSNNPTLGGTTAKVVVTEFSDLSCPACAAAQPVIRQLATDYGDKIKIVFNSYNIGHATSEKSLEAGKCALQQNKFWEFADVAFSKQADWAQASDFVKILKSYAQDLNLDTSKFDTCLDSGSMASEIEHDTLVGQQLKIDSTPTFVINGQQLVGVQTLDEFKKVIDSELAKIK